MPSCRKMGGKKRKSLKYKIVSESTETVRFVPKRFFRKFWFSRCLSMPSSPENSRVCLWNTRTDTWSYLETDTTIHCCVCLHGEKSFTGFRLCATTSIPTTLNNMQHAVQNGTVLGAVGQQCCVHLQRSFINHSYSVKKSTNNVRISLIN